MNLATLVYPLKRFSRQLYNRHIFSSDKLLIPINDNGNHWTLICINFSSKNIQYLDSLGNPGQIYTNSCLQYIKDEHWSKLNAPLQDQNKWTAQQNRDEVPHQIKGYDCGIFVCLFADILQPDPLSALNLLSKLTLKQKKIDLYF